MRQGHASRSWSLLFVAFAAGRLLLLLLSVIVECDSCSEKMKKSENGRVRYPRLNSQLVTDKKKSSQPPMPVPVLAGELKRLAPLSLSAQYS